MARQNPQYGVTYAALRKAWAGVVERGEATCHEPRCIMPNRTITPGTRWHLSHDIDGIRIIGPSHMRCNISEVATRTNKRRANKYLHL